MLHPLLAILATILAIGAADARPRGTAVFGATGAASINLGGGDRLPANFINVFKTASMSFNTPADFLRVDDDGYLTSTPVGNVAINFPAANTMWTGGVQYKMVWGPGLQFGRMTINSVVTSCTNTVNVTIGGCTGSSTTVTPTGNTGGSFTFTTSTNQFSMFFGTTGTYSRTSGELALYRVSDEADYLAGEIFTPEFKSVLATLNPVHIRPKGWVQTGSGNFNGETTWNYRTKLTSFTWGGRWPPGARCGSPNAISGTDTYSGPAAPDTPVTYTDGEQYQCVVTNTNTSAVVTLDVGGRGAKAVVAQDGLSTLAVGGFTAGGVSTFTYDALLDKWLVYCDNLFTRTSCAGSIVTSVPIEAQIQLANRLNKNLWAVVPTWATNDYFNNWATMVRDNLNTNLLFYPEYTNEIWNFAFPQTQWALQRGLALGWSAPSNQAMYGWYGLRVRQMMGTLIPSIFSGQMSRVRRVMAYQGGGDTTIPLYRFNGTQLRSCTSFGAPCGNSVYDTLTGSADYSAFPNRPIDVTEVSGYAPYVVGTNLCTGPDINCTPSSVNLPFYQALVDAVEASDMTTAISLIDEDIRVGRTRIQNVTASGTTFTTPLAHGFTTSSDIAFQVTGGTIYSGVVASTAYRVTSTPTTTTFTMRPYVDGFPSGADVNAGSAGTGTMTVGTTSIRNLVGASSQIFKFGEANAALYDTARNGAGMPLVRVEQYEGDMEPKGLTSAQCATVGVTGVTNAQCATDIQAALTAWKFDTKARDTQIAYFKQFMGTDPSAPPTFGLMPHSRSPSQLVLSQGGSSCTNSDYALLSGCLPNSTPFQLFYGFQQFNFLLKRDLDPASNDNDPMWLEKAA